MGGLFITFEGIDFCGKTTQARRLASYLRKNSYEVILLREPGGGKIGEKVRKILLSQTNSEMTALTEVLLYEAARSQLTERTILPALRQGKAVVCDRYSDSTLAYQGYGRGLDKRMIKQLNRISTFALLPDLTILLDVPVWTSIRRGKKEKRKKDRLEKEALGFHQRTRDGFLKIASQNPKRIKVVDGTRDINETWQMVERVVDQFLSRSRKVGKRTR